MAAAKPLRRIAHRLREIFGPGRYHGVEGPADLGEVQRDCRRWSVLKLREADDGRAQVAPAGAREVAIAGKPVNDSLQRRRSGGLGKGIGFMGSLPADS